MMSSVVRLITVHSSFSIIFYIIQSEKEANIKSAQRIFFAASRPTT